MLAQKKWKEVAHSYLYFYAEMLKMVGSEGIKTNLVLTEICLCS